MRSIALPTRRATIRLAHALAAAVAPGDLVVFTGGLGAGKTFLVRAMLRALGVPDQIAVPSPTFTLLNEYGTDTGARVPVIHADLYRLLGSESLDEEITELGLRARRGEGWALVVEWGGDVIDPLGGDALSIEIVTDLANATRVANIRASGPRGESLASALVNSLAKSVR
jgi:tRNA threonylcarbamoyl adenosine modification protein YjeE